MNDEPVGRRAGLADIPELRDERAFHGAGEIGIVEDQEGRVSAQFHGGSQDVGGGLLQQHPPHLSRPGEADLAQAAVRDDRDRKSVVKGKSVSERLDLGGRRVINKKNNRKQTSEVTHTTNK